jgi:FHS family L-fucose permease-like MFS transporter
MAAPLSAAQQVSDSKKIANEISLDAAATPNYTVALAAMMALHFMIGFLTCLNDILVPHLKAVFELNYTRTMFIQFTFFTAYFVMSLPAGRIIAAVGYKRAMMIGLATSATGALLFYPAAAVPAYGIFLAALFTLATGFTILQVAINPYAAVLGRPETASSRLTLTQAFNSLGTTVAPRIGGLFILSASILTASQIAAMTDAERVAYKLAESSTVQMPYLVFATILVLLAVVLGTLKLPVIAAVEDAAHQVKSGVKSGLAEAFAVPRVRLGALGIFTYVGAEVAIGSFIIFAAKTTIGLTNEQAATFYVSLYWGGAMVGRFLGAALLVRTGAGVLLALYAGCAAVLVATGMFATGAVALWAIVAIGFFNSIMFPNIFTLGIAGVGRLTGYASSIITMAIVGGAVVPLATGALADVVGVQRAFVLPLLCYGYILWFALWSRKQEKEPVQERPVT